VLIFLRYSVSSKFLFQVVILLYCALWNAERPLGNHTPCVVPQVAHFAIAQRVAQQPFKPPMNFSVIKYDSGKCIVEYLRMSDNLKPNLGGFWHFPISFRENYCRFMVWLRNISVKTQKFQVKIVKIRKYIFGMSWWIQQFFNISTRKWWVEKIFNELLKQEPKRNWPLSNCFSPRIKLFLL
jgi:hypothetical protein